MAVTFLVLMCVASATRIGYVIYPINFAVWAWMTKVPAAVSPELVTTS